MLRRCFDIVFSLAFLACAWPLLLLIAILIKRDSPGPVFFRQERVGHQQRLFWIYKFRTMTHQHTPSDKLDFVKKDDPRITKLGRFLRNASLDEIPQFWNVLKGDMSVIGPRPLPVVQVEYLASVIPNFRDRHQVKPGITGAVQISDLRSCVDSIEEHQQRLELDLLYIADRTVWTDLHIILKTIWTMLARYNTARRYYPLSGKKIL